MAKKNKKQKYLHEAFSKGYNVMPSLTAMSLKKISQQLHSLPLATDCLVSGSAKSGPKYLFSTLHKINFTELSLIGCLCFLGKVHSFLNRISKILTQVYIQNQ